MSTRLSGLLAAGGLVGAVAIGCSSSTSPANPSNEGGLMHPPDSGIGHLVAEGGEANAPSPMDDGTTGKLCKTDMECQTVAGTNVCSSRFVNRITNVLVTLWNTGVCIKPLPTAAGQGGNCDPTDPMNDPMGQFIHFCDGPDDPSSPGMCIPFTNPAQAGQGLCFPKCTFKTDGTAAIGCAGHNACGPVTYFMDPMTQVITGYGFCQGACSTDSDCADLPAPPGDAGTYHCQTDIGLCTTTPITKRAKNIGDACSRAGTTNDETKGSCNCIAGTTNLGFCSSVCTVGGAPCPNGWACDSGEPASLSFQMGAMMVPLTKQTAGSLGICTPLCMSTDAAAPASDASPPASDGSAPAATGCPANSSCTPGPLVGANCQP